MKKDVWYNIRANELFLVGPRDYYMHNYMLDHDYLLFIGVL